MSADKKRNAFGEFFRQLEADAKADEKPPTLRLFERKVTDGHYYTVHGEDNANYVADEFFQTRDVIKYHGNDDNKIAGVTLRPQKVTTILKHILVRKASHIEKVELWTRNETDNSWQVTKKASPGNIQEFEDTLFAGEDMTESCAVMAIKLSNTSTNERLVGVAFADATLRTLDVCEFVDSDRFANLESVVVQRGAKECLVNFDKPAFSSADQQKVLKLLERCGVPATEGKSSDFKANDLEQDIGRLVGSLEQHHGKLEKKNSMAALLCLVKYLELLRDESGFGRFKLRTFDLSQFMKLDKAAVEALNLFPQPTDSDKNACLYGLLNKGKTASGSRLLMQWLKQPLLELAAIDRRLNYVELFSQDQNLREQLRDDHLRRVPDLDRMAKKFQKNKANLQSVVDFYRFCVCLPGLVNALADYSGVHQDLLKQEFTNALEGMMSDLSQFEAMVEQTVDLDAVDNHEYLINPAFDPRLEELAAAKRDVQDQIDEAVEEVARDLGLDASKVKLNHTPQLGDHFRISRKDEKVLRKKAKYSSLETRKDGVRFTCPSMKKLSAENTDIKQQYEHVQKEIVDKALEITLSYTPVMEQLNEVIAELDVLCAFAHVSQNAPTQYVRPTMLVAGSGKLEMTASRHPCMEMMESSLNFIPNDVMLERGESNVQVITGPNMGGKSTFIRQVGVVCLLAQIGCFVPCEAATLTVVDCILARVGAGDSQLKGVSTFMKEMLEAAAILRQATENSLVIIDELGRGTSTYDGFGLAWAICEHIAKSTSGFCMFATHFHELTALADTNKSVVNRHVTAHTTDNDITMLYTVNEGPCDRSFGIHVSELANFPPEVVEVAKRKAEELENFGKSAGIDLAPTLTAMAGNADEEASAGSPAKRLKTDGSKRISGMALTTDGKDAVNGFLRKFKSLPLDKMSQQELNSQLQDLRSAVAANPVLSQHLQSQC
mmetsp:Transcript_48662/g.95398  ORF Transcript_48662/g.95398 Transcript_48662/m.95398 type:complete len:948 (-) Transcript_48662:170-3013(-)